MAARCLSLHNTVHALKCTYRMQHRIRSPACWYSRQNNALLSVFAKRDCRATFILGRLRFERANPKAGTGKFPRVKQFLLTKNKVRFDNGRHIFVCVRLFQARRLLSLVRVVSSGTPTCRRTPRRGSQWKVFTISRAKTRKPLRTLMDSAASRVWRKRPLRSEEHTS